MEFTYRARTKAGEIESDSLEANSREEAMAELRSRGLLPLELSESSKRSFNFKAMLGGSITISLLDKIAFLRNLSVMMKAGLATPRALQILADQTPQGKFKDVLTSLSHDVRSGKSLSEAMSKFPDVFGPLYISLVGVGEQGGNLDKNIDYLVGYLRRDYELVKKTKGALTYPIVVMVALVIVVILMFTFILPKLVDTFKELNVELPLMTKVLIQVVNIFSSYSYLIIFGLIGLVFAARFFLRSPSGRVLWHRVNLMLPIINGATIKLNLARFTLTLSSLMNSGMPIVEAVQVSGKSLTNTFFSRAAVLAADKVRSGVPLSDALNSSPQLFPSLMVQMIKVGEESGAVEKILQELNIFYEEELDEFIKNLSSIIEPVMVIIVGLFVGFLAMALITPIYNISQSV